MITAIVPTTNDERAEHVELLLRTLDAQTRRPDEVLIAAEEESPRLRVAAERHGAKLLVLGLWNKCEALNRAVLAAKGDVLVLLEDDLALAPTFLEEVAKPLGRPEVGCVYSRCVWVHLEGLGHRPGLRRLAARAASKLSVHESVLARRGGRPLGDGLYEAWVFTMSVACRREALLRAGLWDESVEEPVLGEDYDVAFRVRKAGYVIAYNPRAVSLHFTRQASKRAQGLRSDPRYLEGVNRSEVYFVFKNADLLGPAVMLHALYRMIESAGWGLRARKPLAIYYGVRGVLEGASKGLKRLLHQDIGSKRGTRENVV